MGNKISIGGAYDTFYIKSNAIKMPSCKNFAASRDPPLILFLQTASKESGNQAFETFSDVFFVSQLNNRIYVS